MTLSLTIFIFQSRILSRSPVLPSRTHQRRLSNRAGGGAGAGMARRAGEWETVSTRADRARDRPSNWTIDTN